MNRIERRVLLWGAIVGTLVGNVVLVVILPHVVNQSRLSEYAGPLAVGWLLAQVTLVASWCALARQPLIIRLPLSITLMLLGGGMFLLMNPDSLDEVIVMGLFPFFYLQGPLWLVRWLSRRRIMLAENESVAGTFSIRYLLMLTATVAAMVALYQVALKGESIALTGHQMAEWLIVSGSLFLYAAALGYPCIWLMLSQQPSTRLTAAIVLFSSWLASPLLMSMFVVALNRGSVTFWEPLPFFLCFGLGLAGGMLLGMYVLRVVGYRLLPVGRTDEVARGA